MKDIAREKYVHLMALIDRLENLIDEMENTENPDPAALASFKQQLADTRNELARISDGCGKPHPK